jgi:hypothetical protein
MPKKGHGDVGIRPVFMRKRPKIGVKTDVFANLRVDFIGLKKLKKARFHENGAYHNRLSNRNKYGYGHHCL